MCYKQEQHIIKRVEEDKIHKLKKAVLFLHYEAGCTV